MIPLFALCISGFVLCWFATPVCRDIFTRVGLVDHPEEVRKHHKRAVPRLGGIPIVLSYVGALGLFYLLVPAGTVIYVQHRVLLLALLPATAIVFLTGLTDDIWTLRPIHKLIGQICGALLAVSLGIRLPLHHAPTWLGFTISVVWLVACSNAVNLIDGMDGLATGVGLTATITSLLVGVITGNYGLAIATVPLAGCLLAFLRYNFSPASIFLGDCGSLTIGFVLGCFGLIWSQTTGIIGAMAPLVAFALPLADVGLALSRRFLRKVPIFGADRGHIHHMVLALGFSPRGAALVLYGVCVACASLALLFNFIGFYRWPALVLFGLLMLFGVRRLGYVEFSAAGRVWRRKVMRRAVRDEIYLHDLDVAISNATSTHEYWVLIREVCKYLEVDVVKAQLQGQRFEETFRGDHTNPSLRVEIPLGSQGEIAVLWSASPTAPAALLTSMRCIQDAMLRKKAIVSSEEGTMTDAA